MHPLPDRFFGSFLGTRSPSRAFLLAVGLAVSPAFHRPAFAGAPSMEAVFPRELLHIDPARATVEDLARIETWTAQGKGEPAMPLLMAILARDGTFRQEKAARLLAQIGTSAVPLLRSGLQNPDDPIARFCATALGDMGSAAADAVPDLKATLASRAWWSHRSAAATALGRIGPRALSALPVLEAHLTDENAVVRTQCALAAARLAGNQPQYVQVIVAVLQAQLSNPAQTVNLSASEALEALRELAPESQAATPVLVQLIESPHFYSLKNDLLPVLDTLGPLAADAAEPLRTQLHRLSVGERKDAHRTLEKILGQSYGAEAVISAEAMAESKERDRRSAEQKKRFAFVTYELPAVTTITVVNFWSPDSSEALTPGGKKFPVGGGFEAVRSEVVLTGAECDRVAAAWRGLDFTGDEGAFCHEPVYGLRFFRGDTLVLETSVCWGCHNFTVGDDLCGFAKKSPSVEILRGELDRLLPIATNGSP